MDTQYNGQKKNDKQNNTQKTKDQATRPKTLKKKKAFVASSLSMHH
jgi:hypothetical protein